MYVHKFVRRLNAVDALTIAYALLISLFVLVFSGRIEEWQTIILINVSLSISLIAVAFLAINANTRIINFIHDWYPAPLIYFSFKEMYVIIQSLGMGDLDDLLIDIDRWLFGVDPTLWIAQFASPLLTEILQIAYTSFYFLMIAVGYELYVRRDRNNFSFFMFTLLYGFFLSYIGYIVVPAVGPRFTLHDFYQLNNELPGIFVTNTLRDLINAGESIPIGALNASEIAQRDVFPSGHTQMTMIVFYFAGKNLLKSRYVLYLLGTLLIIATVYLRYHYVIDLIAGALFMWFTVLTAPKLFTLFEEVNRVE